jgi:hypothetical protein
MKKVIKGRLYDTDTASVQGSWENTNDANDFHWMCETLLKKKTGEFFLHGCGGPMSPYAERIDSTSWSGGEKIPIKQDEDRRLPFTRFWKRSACRSGCSSVWTS